MSKNKTEIHLTQILDDYNRKMKSTPRNFTQQRIAVIAEWLRQFAWLHPLQDGNGRVRTLLLQRELRYRGVAPGAFMFNNNRDIYFISPETYAAKIQEGSSMALLALKIHSNPWLNKSNVDAHFEHFPRKRFHRGGDWGSAD